MKLYFVFVIALFVFSINTVNAQASGPRKPPTANRPPSTENSSRGTDSSPTQPDKVAETRVVNGLTIVLKRVKGNPADQTVTLELLITNPKGNTRAVLRAAYAVDPEGDNYADARGGGWSMDEILYTDVPRKASISVRGVPSKIKTLALFKFVVANQGDVDLEYRNLSIEW